MAKSMKKFALGEDVASAADVGLPAGMKPVTSNPIGTDLPASQKAAQTAAKVRKTSTEKIQAAWDKLQEEFAVQKMVWGSCAAVKTAQRKPEVEAMQSKLDALLPVQNTDDRQRCLKSLEELVRALGKDGGVLSKGMLLSIKEVIRHEGLASYREKLAKRVHNAMDASTLPQSDAEKDRLEEDLVFCKLNDAKLERKIRQVLRLPPKDVKMGAAADERGTMSLGGAVSLTASRTLDQIMMGVIGTSPSAMRRESTSVGGAVSTGSVSASAYQNMRAGTATTKLRELATRKPPASWKSFQQELDVQKKVWQSLLLTRGKDKSMKENVEMLQKSAEEVFALRGPNTDQALSTLEELLKKDESGPQLLSKSMRAAGMNVVKQHQMHELRLQLAERVEVASVPATLPSGEKDKKELEELVVACDIDDATLHCAVRHLLLLPLPVDLVGPAVGAKKLPSTGSQVGRCNSTGALKRVSRKDSTKSQTMRSSTSNTFTPPARIIEAI